MCCALRSCGKRGNIEFTGLKPLQPANRGKTTAPQLSLERRESGELAAINSSLPQFLLLSLRRKKGLPLLIKSFELCNKIRPDDDAQGTQAKPRRPQP